MTTTLITGANKGIGREAARRLLEAGHDVWVSARDRDRGRAAADELGSKTLVVDPARAEFHIVGLAYQSAKAAVNMLTVQWAKAYPAMRINVVDPGWTVTDLSGGTGPQTVLEGTDALVRMAAVAPDGPTGTFTDRYGVVPW